MCYMVTYSRDHLSFIHSIVLYVFIVTVIILQYEFVLRLE